MLVVGDKELPMLCMGLVAAMWRGYDSSASWEGIWE